MSARGDAPVYLHDLMHALVTSPDGTRPRPKHDGANEAVPVPVLIEVRYTGAGVDQVVTLPCEAWEFFPYQSIKRDDGGRLIRPERSARLVFAVAVPDGYTLVKTGTEPDTLAAITTPATVDGFSVEAKPVDPAIYGPDSEAAALAATRAANDLPPVTDPDVFKVNTDKPAGYNTTNKGGPPNQGGEP